MPKEKYVDSGKKMGSGTYLICIKLFLNPTCAATVESRKFEVLGTRDFISKYRKFKL